MHIGLQKSPRESGARMVYIKFSWHAAVFEHVMKTTYSRGDAYLDDFIIHWMSVRMVQRIPAQCVNGCMYVYVFTRHGPVTKGLILAKKNMKQIKQFDCVIYTCTVSSVNWHWRHWRKVSFIDMCPFQTGSLMHGMHTYFPDSLWNKTLHRKMIPLCSKCCMYDFTRRWVRMTNCILCQFAIYD